MVMLSRRKVNTKARSPWQRGWELETQCMVSWCHCVIFSNYDERNALLPNSFVAFMTLYQLFYLSVFIRYPFNLLLSVLPLPLLCTYLIFVLNKPRTNHWHWREIKSWNWVCLNWANQQQNSLASLKLIQKPREFKMPVSDVTSSNSTSKTKQILKQKVQVLMKKTNFSEAEINRLLDVHYQIMVGSWTDFTWK